MKKNSLLYLCIVLSISGVSHAVGTIYWENHTPFIIKQVWVNKKQAGCSDLRLNYSMSPEWSGSRLQNGIEERAPGNCKLAIIGAIVVDFVLKDGSIWRAELNEQISISSHAILIRLLLDGEKNAVLKIENLDDPSKYAWVSPKLLYSAKEATKYGPQDLR